MSLGLLRPLETEQPSLVLVRTMRQPRKDPNLSQATRQRLSMRVWWKHHARLSRRDAALEHFPEKWMPVFRRKCDQVSTSRPLSDSTQSESGLGHWLKRNAQASDDGLPVCRSARSERFEVPRPHYPARGTSRLSNQEPRGGIGTGIGVERPPDASSRSVSGSWP